MGGLSHTWFIFNMLNRILTIFGLYVPIKCPNKTLNSQKGFKKVTCIVLLSIICLTVFTFNGIHRNTVKSTKYLVGFVETGCCVIILSLRLYKIHELEYLLEVILPIQPKEIFWSIQEVKSLILKNLGWFAAILILFAINVSNVYFLYSFYGKCFVYSILEVITYALLIFENTAIAYLIKIMILSAQDLKGSLNHFYSEFYKVPPAELKKMENGDFILTGWITQALNFRKNVEVVPLVENVAHQVIQLKKAVNTFNKTFGLSMFCTILCATVRFIDISHSYFISKFENVHLAYVSVGKILLILVYLNGVTVLCKTFTKEIIGFGNRSFKLYLDMPSMVFIKEEIEMKGLLGLISGFVLNENWALMATKIFCLNYTAYQKINAIFLVSLQAILLFKKY